MVSITRRRFGAVSFSGALSLATAIVGCSKVEVARAQVTSSALPERDPDDWIRQWKAESLVNKDLQGPLDLRRFKDPWYVLLEPIGWKPRKLALNLPSVSVPKGFVTDFASIPRVFWSIFKPDGNYAYAAVVHDYMYWQQQHEKIIADAVFRAVMDDLKITDWQSSTLFLAVEKFGLSAWSSNAVLKSKGEKRILTKLPDRPDITWGDWKRRNDVF